MGKRDSLFKESFSDGRIVWPVDETARKNLAQQLYGASMIACVDEAIRSAQSLLQRNVSEDNTLDPEGAFLREKKMFVNAFKELSEQERLAIKMLVNKTASELLHAICVKHDQFPGADIEIDMIDRETGKRVAVAAPAEDELRIRYFEWIKQFSDFV